MANILKSLEENVLIVRWYTDFILLHLGFMEWVYFPIIYVGNVEQNQEPLYI